MRYDGLAGPVGSGIPNAYPICINSQYSSRKRRFGCAYCGTKNNTEANCVNCGAPPKDEQGRIVRLVDGHGAFGQTMRELR